MTRRILAATIAAVATILTSACSNESTGPSGSQLSREDIVALARALQGQPLRLSATKNANPPAVSAIDLFPQVDSLYNPWAYRAPLTRPTADHAPLETIDVRIDTLVQCAGGQGSLALSARIQGTSDEQGKNATLQVEATMTHRGCAIEIAPARTIEVTGTPNLVSQLSFLLTNGELADPVTGTTRGSFTWRTATGAGQCTVDITGSFSPSTTKGRVRGTLCGMTIDETT